MKTKKKNNWKQFKIKDKLKTIKKYTYDDEDSPTISKQKEIFNKLVDGRLDEITKLDKNVNHDDLIYRYKGETPNENFNTYDNALNLNGKIKNGKVKLPDVKNDQIQFKSNLGEIERGPKKRKEQKNELYNIEMLYKARKKVFKILWWLFFNSIWSKK